MRRPTSRRRHYEQFVAAHADGLIRLAYAICGDRGRAEDATQEALARVYQRWSKVTDPLAYARRAVVNTTRDDWRRGVRADRALREAGCLASSAADDPQARFVANSALMDALDALPHGQRAVIVLRYGIYSQTAYPKTPSQDDGPSPSLTSSPAQVRQGLQSAQVTQTGTATINGVRAIALSVVTPRTKGTKLILYVDAQSYQPLRTVQTIDGLPGLMVADWEPATPANIALAQDDSVPAGFKKVSVNTVAPIHPIHHH